MIPNSRSPKPAQWLGYLLHLSGFPIGAPRSRVLLTNAVGRHFPDFVPANARGKLILEARLHLAAMAILAIAGIAFGWTWILTLWVIPALLGQPFLRAYLMAEHGACPLVANMLANSRTTYTNRSSASSPGTCPSTAPIMPCRPCRSIACRHSTAISNRGCR